MQAPQLTNAFILIDPRLFSHVIFSFLYGRDLATG